MNISIDIYNVLGDVMTEKTNNKNIQFKNNQNTKRKKFLKPLITDDDFKDESDVYFSIVKNRNNPRTKKINENRSSFYISPMRGKVEDRSTFPVTSSRGRIGKQYDFLRNNKKQKQEEIQAKYGHKYYEFNLLNNSNKFAAPNPPENQPVEETKTDTKSRSLFELKNNVNVIYEEEIDIDENKNIVTSYDENNNGYFYNDYDSVNFNSDFNKYTNQVEITEHRKEPKNLQQELKKLFAEEDYQSEQEITFNEDFNTEFQGSQPVEENIRDYPKVRDYPNTKQSKFNFVNIKDELDKELNKNLKKKPLKKEYSNFNELEHYQFPPLDLLSEGKSFIIDETEWLNEQMERLDNTLESFGIAAKTVNYTQGPSVTRFEVEPEPGIKVSRITALQDDIKLRLAASDIRIEAPISGKSTVGIEVPNNEKRMVILREILESNVYKVFKSPLKIALGLDITGEAVFSDISSMTHTLIAGSTGSGKSVCINAIIISILYNAMPDEVKLVLIDPKKVEFSIYRDIPHLLTPVINDPKIATSTLRWLTEEMDRRYELIESVRARDIKSYNIKKNRSDEDLPKLPYIVVIIDELADLMVIAAQEVEEYIQRISQLARAAGIHLIVATQRPSTNVITGTIKTNIPTRISFKVASAIDSRIILDETGAEKLLGKGDMLLSDNAKSQLQRLQGPFISDEEIEKVTSFVKEQLTPEYLFTSEELLRKDNDISLDAEDELFDDAVRYAIELGEASASKIQRKFKVGYNRAARMIDMMEEYNIIGPQQGGSKPREVLMTMREYENLITSY